MLLSLIQQLGFDLTKDTAVKIKWLTESILTLNMSDKIVAEHAPNILGRIRQHLEELYPKYASVPVGGQLKILMHVINSMLK